MKKLLLLFFLCSLSYLSFSQGAPACPNVTTGPTKTICNGQSATLTSTLVTSYATSSYSVGSISYSPYPFTGTPILVNIDDNWSALQNLLFPFCFFGNTYTQCVVGANGEITFNTAKANTYEPWKITASLPVAGGATQDATPNSICAAFRDIDPSVSGDIYYQTGGSSPCRYVVISWVSIPLYSCGSPNSTFQVVLYENTNFIDVYIQNSSGSCGWNSGYGEIGIQNSTATTAVVPPSRNMSAWSATNEAWRFTPTGAASYSFSWSGPGTPNFSTATSVAVSPTVTSTYTASMVITNCDGSTFTTTATEQVVVNNAASITAGSFTTCPSGAVTLTAVSTPTATPVAFNWSTGATTNTISVSPGTTTSYTVTGSTASCTNTAVATVTVAPTPTVTVNSSTICPGSTATLTANGATTYNWTAGVTPTTGSVVTANPGTTTSYTVTGTSATCTNSAVATISVASTLSLSVTGGAICKGQTTLMLTANSNASTFTWSPATGLSATTGSVVVANPTTTQVYTVVGAAGTCTVSTTVTVTVNNPPALTATSSTICLGQQTGSVTINGASTYTWSGGGINGNTTTNPTDNPASTTVYSVNATDVNTCTATATATITVNTPPTLTVTSSSICNGAGPATLGVSGASTYTWTGGGITGSHSTAPSDNPGGTTVYTVGGTDAHTCTATATGTITVMGTPTISVTGSGAICKGQTTLNLTANSNATSFAWSPATGLSATTGTTVVANPTTTQNYTIVGTAGTCTAVTTATVTVNNPPTLATTSSTICVSQQTGSVTVNGASTYSWSGGGITGNTTTNPTDNPVSTTVYTVNATDVNTCTATATATITVNPLPTVGVNSPSTCNGSTATLTATGATTYSWTAGLSATSGTSVTGNPITTTPYTVTGTDANGCKNTAVATINVISNPTITVNSGPICAGQTTLSLTANSNATSFAWAPATGLSATTGSMVIANPVATQVYTIVGTASGCTVSTTATVTVNTPPTLTTTSSTICVSQQTGSVTVSGASTYTWTGGGITGNTTTNPTDNPNSTTIYTVNATDVNTCTATATATATITVNPLPIVTVNSSGICLGQQTATLTAAGATTYSWTAGLSATSGVIVTGSPAATTSYTVTGTDVNGCTDTSVATITVISNPTITVANGAMCVGEQTVSLTANSNATNFVWSPATGLSVTTGSVVTANPTTVGPNTYTIVGSTGSCTVSTTAVVTVYALPVPTASANVPCETENQLNLTSMVAPAGTYTYSWSGPNSYSDNVQNSSITILNNVTQAVAGPYTVSVLDNNGCYNSATVTVVVNPKPVITATGATVCVGQTINLTSNGAGSGNYSWNGQSSFNSAQQNPFITNAVTTMTGIYNVVGTDANGCYSGTAVQVQVNPLPVINILNSGPMCVGQGVTTLTATSTNAGTTYNWTPVTALSATTGSIVIANPSPAGTYTYLVTGTDANTCVGTFSTSVLVNALPVITANSGTICVGQQTVNLTANSTNAGTTYSWSPATGLSSTTSTVVAGTPTVTTNYVVTGTDGNGCISSGNVSILVNNLPTISATSGTICTGQTVNLTASGGLTYSWTPGTGLANTSGVTVAANPITTQSYVVIGTDANGCISTGTSHVLVYALPIITVTSATICMGQQTATLSASGASTYSWSPSNTLSSGTGAFVNGFPVTVGENDYTVTATDVHTCVNTATTSIWVNSLPTVITNTVTPECVPFCTTLTATPTPAGTYTYSWSLGNGQTAQGVSPTACYSVAAIYAVKLLVTDVNGCTAITSTPVNALSIPIADFDYGQQPVSILAPEVQFTNQSTYGLPNHSWNFGDFYNVSSHDTSSLNNPIHTYAEVGTYNVTLTVSTANGCSATVVKPVIINEDYVIYVPNAFSPNGDGKNEFFKAEGEGVKDYKLYVFDRWGLLLFYSDDINKGWDGKPQGGGDLVQEDTYVWKIQTVDFKNKSKNLNGTVTLLK